MDSEYAAQINLLLKTDDALALVNNFNDHGLKSDVKAFAPDIGTLGFDAQTFQNIVLALGSAGAITATAKVLVAYLKERKQKVTIKKLPYGYEVEAENLTILELSNILAKLEEDDTILIVSRENYF